MNTTELMIGDWVSCGGTPIRVENVHGDCINFQHDIPFVQEEFMIDFAEIVPISLTPEILEKNGFEHKHNGEPIKRQYWIINIGGGSIKVKVNRNALLFNILGVPFREGYYKPSFDAHIQYIHEFQHALRLCGMNELADNFKI